MRNKKSLYLILVLILVANLIGCTKKTNPTLVTDDYKKVDLYKVNNYEIQVDFAPSTKSYFANQSTTYINTTGKSLDKIYFHLYPRAYSSLDTAPILFESKKLQENYVLGSMEIEKIEINKKEVTYEIGGTTDSILRIFLEESLKPNEKINIYMEYRVKLPENIDRFGYGKEIFNFGNWYPILAVYDEKGWNLDPYYSLGDPFYSDIANYQVTITTDKDMVIATSGNILYEKTRKDKKVYKIEGKLLRDFAWVASPNFKIREIKAGDTIVKLYYLDEGTGLEDFALEVGRDSIEIFNKIFGKYPYGQYSIVMTEFPTGMEYPSLVFIGRDYFRDEYKNSLETVIVHETAHQWWYGIVGNDQIDEAWLDESLATYSEVIYMTEKYGEEIGKNYYSYSVEISYDFGKEIIENDTRVVKPLNEFKGWDDYGLLVYTRGAVFLEEIKREFGQDSLYNILSTYYDLYKFNIATTEDFIKVCETITNRPFETRANRWLYGR